MAENFELKLTSDRQSDIIERKLDIIDSLFDKVKASNETIEALKRKIENLEPNGRSVSPAMTFNVISTISRLFQSVRQDTESLSMSNLVRGH